jgi:hypothetical protein
MNRSALALLLVVGIVMVLSGCQPAATDTNRNAANATASPAKETYDAAAIQAAVLKVERDWFKAGENV